MQKKTLGRIYKRPVSTSGLREAELNSYLQAPNADGEPYPLEWWKTHCAAHPRVSLLAKHYLCISATSSPSERAFSPGGNVVTCHRAALKPDAVDRLVFLATKPNNRSWMMWTRFSIYLLWRLCCLLKQSELIYCFNPNANLRSCFYRLFIFASRNDVDSPCSITICDYICYKLSNLINSPLVLSGLVICALYYLMVLKFFTFSFQLCSTLNCSCSILVDLCSCIPFISL